MSAVQLLNILKTQLLLFFDELIAILPEEKDFLVIRFFIKDQVPITVVMDYIIRKIVPLEQHILEKNEAFLLQNQILFEDLRQHDSKVNYFKRLWEQSSDEENKKAIWNWFEYFVSIGKKYQKLNKTA